MCSDIVFTMIVLDFINIARKLRKLPFITSIYPNESSVNFQSCDFCKFGVYPHRLNPLIVETKK